MKFMFSLQHPLTCNPSTTLSNPCNKVRGEYFSKEVFLRPSFQLPFFVRLYSCVCRLSCVCYHCVGMYAVYICMQQKDMKIYFGVSAGIWKQRFYDDSHSFSNLRNQTTLSQWLWRLKDSDLTPLVRWNFVKRSSTPSNFRSRCNLCLEEKITIIKCRNTSKSLNQRNELKFKYHHKNGYELIWNDSRLYIRICISIVILIVMIILNMVLSIILGMILFINFRIQSLVIISILW